MKIKTLKQYREDKNLTQLEASKILEINTIYLSHIENGRRNPSDSLKNKMSKLYKVPVTDIFLASQLPKW